jgi:acyl-CoA dehydrogenase
MVDFSLTEADQRLIALAHRENEIGRKYARDYDRKSETQPSRIRGVHPDVADLESPHAALEREQDQTSGLVIAEALMDMVSATDVNLRDTGEDAFGTWMLNDYGSEEQKARYGHLRLAIAITEPGAGSDPANMRTNARYDPSTDEYVLNGEKVFISFFNKFDGAVTLMKGEPDGTGKTSFMTMIVTKDLPGVAEIPQFHKLGIRSHELSGFHLQDVRAPAIARLDADFGKTMSKFNHNRPLVAAHALSGARSMLDFTHARLAEAGLKVDYAKGRSARSADEDKLIRMEALWEAAWGTVMRAKWLEHQMGSESHGYRVEASVAKALGGKIVRQITQGCLEILGPEGLSEEYLAEKWFRDVRIADIYEGAGEIQRILIARALLGYKTELN